MDRGKKKTVGLLVAAVGVAGLTSALIAGPVSASDGQPESKGEAGTFSVAQVKTMTNALDDASEQGVPGKVTQWGPSSEYDGIVVRTLPGGQQAAESFVQRAGLDADAVTYQVTKERPQTYADLVGGDAYLIAGTSRCSVGFSVEGGFVTAGHCGSVGDPTTGADGTEQGQFEESVFPGQDMAFVGVNENWTPTPQVAGESGNVEVLGSEEAEVGAEVCRSGSTTGWHCGEIVAKDQSVSYPQGTVDGMTETTVCAEPGDSGGSYISDGQAQGVTSGGSGDCTSGGVTYFFPVNDILDEWGLTLVTASSATE